MLSALSKLLLNKHILSNIRTQTKPIIFHKFHCFIPILILLNCYTIHNNFLISDYDYFKCILFLHKKIDLPHFRNTLGCGLWLKPYIQLSNLYSVTFLSANLLIVELKRWAHLCSELNLKWRISKLVYIISY